ncbi:major facilitator superfamily domain-containing protein [Thelonectria olida]|uniref:Major facilitator superfamily domain-containing protein n=1 Tax=Thelonectria olida TaxID=1576542 RepID=A0A9P9AIN3_9HYPO|nr:major facilitator superfamily domain-containing protein [Thelonectria olida]
MHSLPEPSQSTTNDEPTTQNADLEAARDLTDEPAKGPEDADLVTWDGPNDAENPKNWATKEKWALTAAVSLFTFISPISSSMIAPALEQLGKDLDMTKEIEVEMAMSIFILGYALGPLFFGPVSEIFGRARILQLSNLFYLAWNLGCGFAQNRAELFVFRFLTGIGGSAPLSVGGGVLSDVWPAEERGKAVGVYSLAPLLGPVIGPIAGGFIAEHSTWRWVFWSTSMVAGLVQLAGIFWLRETYAPVLLSKKRDRLVKETGNLKLHVDEESDKRLLSTLGGAIVRPSRMLLTQPIVQVIALYMAYIFGLTYLITVSYPRVWTEVYHESPGIGGLNFISLGLGSILGAAIAICFVDRIYRRLKKEHGDVGLPEFRVPSMFVGSILIPIGIFWYGWSVQARVHWIMPNMGVAILAAGTIVCLQGMQGYIIDTYSRFSASGLAAAVVLRSLAGFGFPLFAPYLNKALGYGWGSSVLGILSIAIGIPAPIIFWYFGARLRAVSKYAIG